MVSKYIHVTKLYVVWFSGVLGTAVLCVLWCFTRYYFFKLYQTIN